MDVQDQDSETFESNFESDASPISESYTHTFNLTVHSNCSYFSTACNSTPSAMIRGLFSLRLSYPKAM